MEGRNTGKREQFQQKSLLLFTLSFIWIISALSGAAKHPNASILLFVGGITLFKPVFQLACRSAGVDRPNEDSSANLLITCLTIALPVGMMAVFFPFVEDINLFFPSFAILLAIVFGIAAYNTRSITFWFVAPVLAMTTVYDLLWYQESFMMGALLPGIALALSGFLTAITGEIYIRTGPVKERTAKLKEKLGRSPEVIPGKSSG